MQHHESMRHLDSSRTEASAHSEAERPALKSSPYPAIIGKGILAAARVNNALWDLSLWRLEDAQQSALRDLVRHARDTERAQRPEDADRDLAPVGDEYLAEHQGSRLYIRNTP